MQAPAKPALTQHHAERYYRIYIKQRNASYCRLEDVAIVD